LVYLYTQLLYLPLYVLYFFFTGTGTSKPSRSHGGYQRDPTSYSPH
jgi:hypothetical protein